jgi:hypothetical protein
MKSTIVFSRKAQTYDCYPSLERDARQVFEHHRQGNLLTVPGATKLFIGQLVH